MAYNPNDIQWNQPAQPAGQPTTNALVSNPYAGTIGQNSTAAMNTAGYVDNPAGRALYRAGAPAPQAPQQPPAPQQSTSDQDILNAFRAASGFSLKELAERKRQFDAQLEWQKELWRNQGLPELQIRQQAQALAQQEFEAQNKLAQQNFALAQELGRGNLAVSQGNLGLDYLKTAASLGGPADYFAQANFLRGAAANSQVPAFLSALGGNTGLAAFNAPSGPAPAVQSMQGLVGGLTGAPAPIDQQAALSSIGRIGAAGGQALAPQALEQLTPDEINLLQSGLRANGFSMPSFLQSYAQSRVGQRAAGNY